MGKAKKNDEQTLPLSTSLVAPEVMLPSEEFSEFPEELLHDLSGALSENMEGVIPQLPLIRILHAGAKLFAMPDESRQETFTGIIVDHTPANAYWAQEFSDSMGRRPDCSSLDGIVSLEEGTQCGKCPHNQFGSAATGRGKACKNMKRLAILLDGHLLPFRLSIPPSSIRIVDQYITFMTDLKRPICAFETVFGLETGANEDGIEYSKLALKPIDPFAPISPQRFKEVIKMRREWKDQIRGQAIETEEYTSEESDTTTTAPPAASAPPIDDDAPPF